MIWLRLKKFDRQEMYFNNLSLMCHSAESVLTWCMDYWDRGSLRYMWSVVYSCGKWWMCVVKVYELCTCTYVRVSHLIRHFLYQFLFLYIDSVISSDSGLSNSLECNHKSLWSNSMLQVPAMRLVFDLFISIIRYLLKVWWSVIICFV